MSMFHHESLHRGAEALERLASVHVTLCGAGALGSPIAEGLARSGCRMLTIVDQDRVEERNLSTQGWDRADIGSPKARLLANALYRAVGAEVEAKPLRLVEHNVRKLLRGSDLVVDAFDNSPSRQLVTEYCRQNSIPCLHAGLADGYGEVIWNDLYRVPGPSQDDVCDYPLARNLATLASAVACEVALGFLLGQGQRSFTVTLADLSIRPYE